MYSTSADPEMPFSRRSPNGTGVTIPEAPSVLGSETHWRGALIAITWILCSACRSERKRSKHPIESIASTFSRSGLRRLGYSQCGFDKGAPAPLGLSIHIDVGQRHLPYVKSCLDVCPAARARNRGQSLHRRHTPVHRVAGIPRHAVAQQFRHRPDGACEDGGTTG